MVHVYAESKKTTKNIPDNVSARQTLHSQSPKLNLKAILLFLFSGFNEK